MAKMMTIVHKRLKTGIYIKYRFRTIIILNWTIQQGSQNYMDNGTIKPN